MAMKSMDISFLQYALDCGIIDLSDVKEKVHMKAKKEILEKHQFKVWHGKDGYWRTYLQANDSKRKLVKKSTKEKLEDAILEFYKNEKDGKQASPTFKDCYGKWLEVHSLRFTSENTLIKYQSDYKRFFRGRALESMEVASINEETIEKLVLTLVRELKLSKKACKTLCGYIRNTLKSARINKLIPENPFDNMEAKSYYPYCTERYKTVEERTVSQSEFELLYERFEKDYQENPHYIPTYAVEFASITGFRASEISALEWSDIEQDRIVVRKAEKYNRTTKEYYIGETKNLRIRYMPLTDEIRDLLNRVRQAEEQYGYLSPFVFSDDKGRVHAPIISSCAKNKCKQIGIPVKSIHAYRRTLSSRLKCNGISSTIVSSIMGHTEDVNEKYYTYDVSDIKEKQGFVQVFTTGIAQARAI